MKLVKKEPKRNRYNLSLGDSADKAGKKLMRKYKLGRSELVESLLLQALENDS